jgi:hypothetical protein
VSVCAEMCCYSTVTTPLSILEVLGVVWFAAGPATRVDLKNWIEFAYLFVRTDRWPNFARSLWAIILLSGNMLCSLD